MLQLEIGKKYIINGFAKDINKTYRHSLLSMGMLPGKSFLVKRFAPFSKTVQIELDQYNLSLRESELQAVYTSLLD